MPLTVSATDSTDHTGNPTILYHSDDRTNQLFVLLSKESTLSEDELVRIETLIKNGAMVNDQNQTYNHSPLHTAATHGHLKACKTLIQYGANVNAVAAFDGCAISPLHTAAFYGHPDVVRLLLENGANVDYTDFITPTPLHLVASVPVDSRCALPIDKLLEVCTVLIDYGADVNSKPKSCAFTSVLCDCQSVDLCKLLIERGAIVDKEEVQSETVKAALLLMPKGCTDSASKANEEKMKSMIHTKEHSNAAQLARDLELFTIIVYGYCKYKLNKVKKLLLAGANPNLQDATNRRTLLHYAALSCKEDLMRLLIENGADVHKKDKYGATAADIWEEKSDEIERLLLESGCHGCSDEDCA